MKNRKGMDAPQGQVSKSPLGVCMDAVPHEEAPACGGVETEALVQPPSPPDPAGREFGAHGNLADARGHIGKLKFDVGLGKTRTFLAALALAQKEGSARVPVLVVPNTDISQWLRDIESEETPAVRGIREEELPGVARETELADPAPRKSPVARGANRINGEARSLARERPRAGRKAVVRRSARSAT